MNQVSYAHAVRKQMIHTLVQHVSPDTEALVMAWLISGHVVVRKALRCVDAPRLKFIPAGQLRRRDWEEERTLSPEQLEARGYLFLDCGGGRFDQHVLPDSVAENKTSSLHLLLEELSARVEEMDAADRKELQHLLRIMEGVFLVICRNDLTGEDIAPRSLDAKPEAAEPSQDGDDLVDGMLQDMDAAEPVEGKADPMPAAQANVDPTPHTPRHLRNMILGWNAQYPNDPHKVYALASVAFGAIEQNVRMLYDNPEDMHDLDVRKLFRIDEILVGTEAHFEATLHPFVVNDAGRVKSETRTFAVQAEKALGEMERQWHAAIGDYFRHAIGREVEMLPQVEGKKTRKVMVVFGRSESQRFGAVARRGNTESGTWVKEAGQGKKKSWKVTGPRPQPQQPKRAKGDVIIQMYGRGLFVISSVNGIRLDRVAMAIREADLRRQGVEITEQVKAQLASPGNFVYRNRQGRFIHAIYFTNYRGAVGNYFRANPYSPTSALHEQAIQDLVVAALSTHYSVDTSDIVREYMG